MGRWAADGRNIDYNVEVADIQTSGLLPMEEQAKYTPQDKVATAVSVNAGVTSLVATVPMDGFNSFGIGVNTAVSHAYGVSGVLSPDGSLAIYPQEVTLSSSSSTKYLRGTAGLNYLLIYITNSDASSKTYDIWVRKFNI